MTTDTPIDDPTDALEAAYERDSGFVCLMSNPELDDYLHGCDAGWAPEEYEED